MFCMCIFDVQLEKQLADLRNDVEKKMIICVVCALNITLFSVGRYQGNKSSTPLVTHQALL